MAELMETRTTSDKVLDARTSTSEKGSYREAVRTHQLQHIAMLAARARGQSRKRMQFPTLQRTYRKAQHDASGMVVRSGGSYYASIWKYVQRWGFRIMIDLDAAKLAYPDESELADLFRTRIMNRALTFHPYDGRNAGLSTSTVDRLAEQAASAVLRDWSIQKTKTYKADAARRGRVGGMKSKRTRTWTDADLDVLALLTGLTVPQQADAMGRSASTIDRMRSDLKKRSAS